MDKHFVEGWVRWVLIRFKGANSTSRERVRYFGAIKYRISYILVQLAFLGVLSRRKSHFLATRRQL